MTTLDQIASQIRFQLEQLSERNAHHEFEHLCRHLARARICSNILPATGPVSSFGDQGRDFETFRTYLHESPIANRSFIGLASEGPIAFACTLTNYTGIKSKIKSDIETIMSSGTSVIDIHYFCTTDIPSGQRHQIQSWTKENYNVLLEIHDGQAISEYLIDQDIFWIAVRFLNIPSEIYPPISIEDEKLWYSNLLQLWKNAEQPPNSYADFSNIKAAIRHATFTDSEIKDVPFWIDQLELVIASTSFTFLKRRALYEILVASLRGLGSILGYEERVADYFKEIPLLNVPSDLEDAVNLWNYCFGAFHHNAIQVTLDDLIKWRNSIGDKIEIELQAASHSGKRCLLLEIRGLLYLIPEPNQEEDFTIDRAIDSWLELSSLVEEAHLFPLERFADRLTNFLELPELFPLIGNNPKFEILTGQIDEKLTKRHGGFIAAEKCRDRAMAFYNQGKIIRAIKEIHKAKIKWFANETLRGSLLALLFISQCYLEIKLAFAAKYYALTAAHIAANSNNDKLKTYIPRAIIHAAGCDYSLGAYCGFFDLSEIGVIALNEFSGRDDNTIIDEVIEKIVFHGTLVRTITYRINPNFLPFVEKRIGRLKGLEDYFTEFIPVAEKVWDNTELEEQWSEIEKQTCDIPFSDLGQIRTSRFFALGITWVFQWENTYRLTQFAEEILAVLQILLADFAEIDLCLLPTTVNVDIGMGDHFELSFQEHDSNDLGVWHFTIQDIREVKEVNDNAIGLAVTLLEYTSLLPREIFNEKIDIAFKEGLSEKIFFGQPYSNLFREFISEEIFKVSERNINKIPNGIRHFEQNSHEELSWCSAPGPGYNVDQVKVALMNRYNLPLKTIRQTIKHLKMDINFKKTVKKLKNVGGWLDWHILNAVSSLVINYRLTLYSNSHTSLEMYEQQFRKAMNTPENKNAEPVPVSEFSEKNLKLMLSTIMISTLRNNGLELHQPIPDFKAISKFLGERYNYWTDDIEHPDYGFS